MITRKVTKNIWFHELVSKEYLEGKTGISDYEMRLLDIGLLTDMQTIRDFFGKPMIINDGDKFNWRGLRTEQYDNYSPSSMHSWWKAYDFHIDGVDVEEVRQHIIKNRDIMYERIGAIEEDVNWIHVDSRYRPDGSLLRFKP